MARSRAVAALLVPALLAAGACSTKPVAKTPPSPLTAAADLRVTFEGLLREQVYLTSFVIEGVFARNPKAYGGASTALDASDVALAKKLASIFGGNTQPDTIKVLRERDALLIGYAGTAGRPRQQLVLKKLLDWPRTFGAHISTLAPVLLRQEVATAARDCILGQTASFDALARKDAVKADAELRIAADKAGLLGLKIAGGITDQLPIQFGGAVVNASVNFRSKLDAILREHLYLTGLRTGDALVKGLDVALAGAVRALDANSVTLAKELGSVQGNGFEGRFLPLWRGHIDQLMTYATAGKDKAKHDRARAGLLEYAKDFGTFLAGANPRIVAGAMAALIEQHVKGLMAVADAQAKGDFKAAGTEMRKAAAHMDDLASYLVQATIRQHPAIFLTPEASP